MRNTRYSTRDLKFLIWMVVIVFSSATLLFASPLVVPEESINEISESSLVESGIVEQACELIYQGKFDVVGELIGPQLDVSSDSTTTGQTSQDEQPQSQYLSGLAQIVQEYKDISQLRQSAREASYKEQLSKLEQLRVEADSNDVNGISAGDVNDIVNVLSVITNASEFANQAQKEQLLSDTFVKEAIQKAIDKAAEFEVEGKWLEAYTTCYAWLAAIDPNNEAYSDYAQQLLDKATIVLTFEDSPCETREERFRDVEKEMFIRAISFLDLHYLSVIDYAQMASKAIERCKLLAEVTGTLPKFGVESQNEDTVSQQMSGNEDPVESQALSSGQIERDPFSLPDSDKIAAWSTALTALLDAVESTSDDESVKFDKNKFIDVFEEVLKLNETTVDFPQPVLIAQFVEAALSALDPHTMIAWPGQAPEFEKTMLNEFTGIGVEITKQKGLLTVSSLLPDTPAYNSGLDAWDVIEKVDGIDTKDMSLICAVQKITGPKGTKVTLTIKRPGEDRTREITITRNRIIIPTIRGWQRTESGKWLYMIDDQNKIGYVRITDFSAETATSLEKVLLELEVEGMKGLILDLRSNNGGLLDSAVAVADKFLKEGLIVRRQSGFGKMPIYEDAHKKGTHPDYPLVILINSGSASASEIVAGALADKAYKRAILVGTRTHGKGLVQGITSYPGGGAQLKYTMAHYYLPSGQKVESREARKKQGREDWGIGPNVEVELRSDELRKMIEVQRNNDVLVKADHKNINHELKKHTVEETLAADVQLAVGLLIVKSKLIQTETLAHTKMDR